MKKLIIFLIVMMMVQVANSQTIDADAEMARRHHLDFVKQVWQKTDPFKVGFHIDSICKKVDTILTDYDQGKSSCLIIKAVFRHGKSALISRYLVPHYLGLFPDNEVMLAAYSADYATGLSRDARDIITSDKYKRVFPYISLSKESFSVQNWQLENHRGLTHWSGVGGSQTGRGYQLGIIDDYLKNRQDAESETIRNRQWEWFTNVFLTRRAPVSITIIIATPWHTDDIIGRIGREMKKNEDFPQFETIEFPAYDNIYATGTLFPERYSRKWYDEHRAALGPYGTASLLQCNPTPRTGNLFNINKLQTITMDQVPEGTVFCRAWDLASSEAQLIKSNPDYTSGVLMGVTWENREHVEEPIPHVYIKDVIRIRAEAPERNRTIKVTALKDVPETAVVMEQAGAYKDTVIQIRELLKGIRDVTGITVSKDKLVRSTPLQIAMAAGNISIVRAPWNDSFIEELVSFPSGRHDDQVDALSTGFEYLKNNKEKYLDYGKSLSNRGMFVGGERGYDPLENTA